MCVNPSISYYRWGHSAFLEFNTNFDDPLDGLDEGPQRREEVGHTVRRCSSMSTIKIILGVPVGCVMLRFKFVGKPGLQAESIGCAL